MKMDWKVKTLGQVCKIVNGGTPDTKVAEFWDGENLWITPKDMGKLDDIYVDDTLRKLTDAGLKNSSAKILPINSIILSSRAPIGHLAVNSKPITTNQGCKGIIPNENLSSLYLFYFLKNSVELLNSLGTGTTFKELSGAKLAEVEIPLPPLSEQQRIVAILDEAFVAIDKAKENAQKNLQNARELFESYLQSVFANPGQGWEKTSIGNEVDLLSGFAFKSNRYTKSDEDIRLLSGDNIMQGFLRWEDARRWPANEDAEYARYQLCDGDVVLAMDRPWVKAGLKRAMVTLDHLPCLLVQRTARLRVKPSLSKHFLLYLLGSQKFTQHIIGVQSGIGVPHISAQQIKAFEFSKPNFHEQQTLVAKLDMLFAQTKKLEAIYQQKLADLDELKKAILQKAFQGELTTAQTDALAV